MVPGAAAYMVEVGDTGSTRTGGLPVPGPQDRIPGLWIFYWAQSKLLTWYRCIPAHNGLMLLLATPPRLPPDSPPASAT